MAPAKGSLKHVGLKRVGIVGGGMAGLYSALLLKQQLKGNVSVKIFEATDRVGGRVYTHKFSEEPYQYFEAGAMRLPQVDWQKPVFDLITYLNQTLPSVYHIDLIPYQYSCPTGNRVYVNGTKQKDGKVMNIDYANNHLDELGFPPNADATEEAGKLLQDAINPVIEELRQDFETALKKYDCMTLHYYLSQVLGWSEAKINYVEVMSSQTNEFRNGLVDQAILNSDFTGQVVPSWKTIDNGMCRLPEALATDIGKENILLEAPVDSVAYIGDQVEIGYTHLGVCGKEVFDAVILAIPPSAARMIPNKPQWPYWPVSLEHSFRSIHFQPLYKIGLRFKTRFWEHVERPSFGGQSVTDLPGRWAVYPSYGLNDPGKGVLLLYSWMTDSNHWLPKSDEDKVRIALENLQTIYPEVNIADEYAGGKPGDPSYLTEAVPIEWAVKWPLGDATFYAGQFSSLFPLMIQPQKNIYFAGEHLSVYHTWIVGAMDSAKLAVQQMIWSQLGSDDEVSFIQPK